MIENELLGVVKIKSRWRFFAGILAEWIMDYKSYDPKYNPKDWSFTFRDNLLVVDESNANKFCEAMESHEMNIDEVQKMVKNEGTILTFFIDFDDKLYVNGYYDLFLEKYIPKNWRGIMDDPLNYVSDFIRSIWNR